MDYIFGVVGFPIIEVGMAAQQQGIKYVGCRNEQAVGLLFEFSISSLRCRRATRRKQWASSRASELEKNSAFIACRPCVCLVVSGPGILHAIGGLANATVNCWPVICIGGSSDIDQETKGAFQEWPQVESARLACKHVSRPTSLQVF